MAFENLTLFELHLENSRFSASRGDEDVEETEPYGAETEESSGGRGLGRTLGVLFFLAVVGLAVRRYRSGGDGGQELDSVDEAEGISIGQAADQ